MNIEKKKVLRFWSWLINDFDLNSKGDEFREDFLVENKIIENFIKFNNLELIFSFDSISKGKNIDNKMFSYNFLSSAYFKIPRAIFNEHF